MKFVLGGLKSVEASLVKLLKADLPIIMSYRLSKLFDALTVEIKKMEELRRELVTRYGEEKDNNIQVKPEHMEAFSNEFNELLEVTMEVDYEPISVKRLLDFDEKLEKLNMPTINISAIDIHVLKEQGVLAEE